MDTGVSTELDAGTWLLDTSVILDLDDPVVLAALPEASSISVVTLAELAAGPLLTDDPAEQARRQHRLHEVESTYDPVPIDATVARAFGSIAAAVRRAGRQPRRRQFDLLIAAVALAHSMPLGTRNADDLVGLEQLIDVRRI